MTAPIDQARQERWWRWLRLGFIATAALLVVASFIPLWKTDEWWIRSLDYPRLQIFALLLGVAVVLLAFNLRWSKGEAALGAGVIAALGWQLSHFIEYLPGWPVQVEKAERCAPGERLSIVNANVLQTNERYGDVLAMIARERPDIVLLLETDPQWAKAMASLDAAYPYRAADAVPSTYGMILLSKLPMRAEVRHRLQAHVPSIDAAIRLRGGEVVTLKALHPEPPMPGNDTSLRDAELVQAGLEVRQSGRASILVGDLNDVAWSKTSRLFRKLAAVGDPRVGRDLMPTFNAKYPVFRWPLDHAFVTRHWRLLAMHRLEKVGSDHFPIRYDFCLAERASKKVVDRTLDADVAADAQKQVAEGAREMREEP